MQLVRPGPEHLASYVDALERGWSADNERGVEAAREELSRIQADAAAFLVSMEDREAKGHSSRRFGGQAPPGLQALALGRRILRQHRVAVAARYYGATAPLSGAYRLCDRAVEAAPRVSKVSATPHTSGSQGSRPAVRGDHHRSGQHRVTARHRSEWRHLGRALHQTAAVRLQA